MEQRHTRRRLLAAAGAGVTLGLAGCLGTPLSGGGGPPPDTGAQQGPPTMDGERYTPGEFAELRSAVVSGGVSKDGIPSVDEPQFTGASDASLSSDAVVFGLEHDGDVRAYPQQILVHHEIVNDEVGGTPVSVTYCPLTGTALGFERGVTTFGVSGRLLNNNLVMYDRGTDSRWPQILGTAIEGEHAGDHLREVSLTWTTWGAWKRAHPETQVLTENTGFARRYGNDPYGQYNPDGGYYASGPPMFQSLHSDDRVPPKRVVIGARTTDGAVAFEKSALLEDGLRTGAVGPDGETTVVAVADDTLATGFVYRLPDDVTVRPAADGQYTVDGLDATTGDESAGTGSDSASTATDGASTATDDGPYTPDALPLDQLHAFDAMWHAWVGFYPETSYVE